MHGFSKRISELRTNKLRSVLRIDPITSQLRVCVVELLLMAGT